MNRRVIFIAVALGLVVLMAAFLYPRKAGQPEDAPIPKRTDLDPRLEGDRKERPAARRRLIPDQLPHEAGRGEADPAPAEPPAKKPSYAPPGDDDTALAGTEFTPMDDGLREALKVPEDPQLGYGVVVSQIHPDAPTAEAQLEPKDVIVRADKKKVDSLQDLKEHVGEREHTLITVSRGGQLFQVVIHRPYRPTN